MDIQWIYAVLAALVGGGAGFYFGRNSQPDMKIRAELEARAQAADEKHAELSNQVQAHFAETARLVNQLSAQYREVHDHLSQAQNEFTDADQMDPNDRIQGLIPPPPAEPRIEQDQQPRDYSDSNGTLTEADLRNQAAAQ